MRRSSATLVLCLLLVTAGCSALPGLGGDRGNGPAGVEDDRLVDVDTLTEAHVDALTESGYSHEIGLNQTRVVDDERIDTTRAQRTSVAPGAAEYHYQLVNRGDVSSRITLWGNETVAYRSTEANGQRQIGRSDPPTDRALAGVGLLEAHLTAPYEVAETREADGTTLHVLESTDRPESDAAFPQDAENVRSYEARLVVDPDGRILAFEAAAEYDLEGEDAEYELSFEVTELEDPDVQRPDWFDHVEE